MNREDLRELHYITPIANVASILAWGIQSHRRAVAGQGRGLAVHSVALQEVQDRRERVQVPNGLMLHEYANLYVCGRNPMLFLRHQQHREICVLRVAPAVLDIEGTVVTDRNAAARFARFEPAPGGLGMINRDRVFADDWRHPGDAMEYQRHKAQKCAEVLVPQRVAPDRIVGISVSCEESLARWG